MLLRAPYAAAGALAELAIALAPAASTADPKWRRALAGRRELSARLSTFAASRDRGRPLVWFHAPSAGEALQALPVHDRVRAASDAPLTALTWFSPSAEQTARRFIADFRDYLAFDTQRAARIALDALNPAALVYSKLDVWPVLTAAAASRGVPSGMIAATLTESSSRRAPLARALLRDAYAALDLVGAISEGDAHRLVDLGVAPERITVTGDTRYDQVWERASRIDRSSEMLRALANERPTLVAGSTWPADEAPLLAAWPGVRQVVRHARLIIAPHEPSGAHVGPIVAWAQNAGLRVARLDDTGAAGADVVIVDRVGPLGELYALGGVAFVGGGFHRAGLHSVLEPAATGIPVLAGPMPVPHTDLDRLVARGAAMRVGSAQDLKSTLAEWLRDGTATAQRGATALEVIRSGLGAADRAAELVHRLRSTEGKRARIKG